MKRRQFIVAFIAACVAAVGGLGTFAKHRRLPSGKVRWNTAWDDLSRCWEWDERIRIVYCTGRMDSRYKHMVWKARGYAYPGGVERYTGSLEMVAVTTAEVIERLHEWAPRIIWWGETDEEGVPPPGGTGPYTSIVGYDSVPKQQRHVGVVVSEPVVWQRVNVTRT